MIFMRRRVAFLAPASALLLSLILAGVASGYAHPPPYGARYVSSSLVTSYKECTAANANDTHGAPFAFPSCGPPVASSTYLAAGGATLANLLIRVYCHNAPAGTPADPIPSTSPAPADNTAAPPCSGATSYQDVKLSGTGKDVRCRAAEAADKCTNANGTTAPDYSGIVVGTSSIRITDSDNTGLSAPAATVRYPTGTVGNEDVPFAAGTQCVNTAATNLGSDCNFNTTANTIVPGVVKEGKQAVVQIPGVQIFDGGSLGNGAGNPLPGSIAACPPSCFPASDSTVFAVQGIYIP